MYAITPRHWLSDCIEELQDTGPEVKYTHVVVRVSRECYCYVDGPAALLTEEEAARIIAIHPRRTAQESLDDWCSGTMHPAQIAQYLSEMQRELDSWDRRKVICRVGDRLNMGSLCGSSELLRIEDYPPSKWLLTSCVPGMPLGGLGPDDNYNPTKRFGYTEIALAKAMLEDSNVGI
jgi:hypothetical protein